MNEVPGNIQDNMTPLVTSTKELILCSNTIFLAQVKSTVALRKRQFSGKLMRVYGRLHICYTQQQYK